MNTTYLLRLSFLPFALLSTTLLCAACSKPESPPTEQQPEPQAQQSQADQSQAGQYKETHSELNDAIQRPIDKAKGVESTVLDAADQQRADIDAQTGG